MSMTGSKQTAVIAFAVGSAFYGRARYLKHSPHKDISEVQGSCG